ncbi:MAG: polysaccharide deacetylase family protein [Bryobacterales bacterium]|nr:polysaccharide deacetylase family protein [Bryobacterales bacterium]
MSGNQRKLPAADKAALIVSLDLEMYWGWRDVYSLVDVKDRLLRVRSAVAGILEMFERYQIHATWATVGLLFFRTREELLANLPAVKPEYQRRELSPYPDIGDIGANEEEDPFHFGRSLIEAIRKTPHQEIGTHTFSHYYCLEEGQTETAFREDLGAAVRTAAQCDLKLRSLVFPRNQTSPEYLRAARDAGIQSFRGAGSHWIYRERSRARESWLRRAVRLLDAYVNVSGHHTVGFDAAGIEPPFDFPASRLLRPYWRALGLLERLRLARVCSGLEYAARKRRIYHLWFHPEELAMDQDRNLAALETVLAHFAMLRERGEMESVHMGELAARLVAREPAAELEPEEAAGILAASGARC